MKKLFLSILLIAGAVVSAFGQSSPPWRIKEADGNPNVLSPTTIIVTNGTLSCSGKICTITIGTGTGNVSTAVTLTANLPVIGAGGSAVAVGTRSGNTTQYVTTTGAQTNGDCVSIDANGNHVASGAACGGSLVVGTTAIASGTATRLLYETSGNVLGEISGATSDGTTVTLTSPTVNTGITLNAAPLTMSGNISAAAWTTSGIRIKGVAATLTDTSSSGTVATAYTNNLGGNTIAASSSTTFTDYFTTFITQPTAGSNVTFTRRWALGLSGNLSSAGTIVQTSNSATAFESGPNGSTNPVFRLVNSTASAATGISVTGAAAGGGVAIDTLSSGSNETLNIRAKGTGTIVFTFSSGATFTMSSSQTQVGSVFFANGFRAASGTQYTWSDGTDFNAGIARVAASATARFTNGSTGSGNILLGTSTVGAVGTSGVSVLAIANGTAPSSSPADTAQYYTADSAAGDANAFARNEAGEINRLTGLAARNSSSFAKTTDTTLANITGLTRNVEASRAYAFTAVLQSTAAATGGVKFAVSGTATATSISYEGVLVDSGVVVNQTRATALDTTVCASTTSTAGTCTIRGVIVVNAAGTLTLQFAQNASDGGASTVLVNQYMQLIPIS